MDKLQDDWTKRDCDIDMTVNHNNLGISCFKENSVRNTLV